MKSIFRNWTIMRYLRLVLAIVILLQAIYQKDFGIGILALLLMISAIANVGCCGSSACKVDLQNTKVQSEIKYEELGEK